MHIFTSDNFTSCFLHRTVQRINADVPEKLLGNLKLHLQSLEPFKGQNLKEGEEVPSIKLEQEFLLIKTLLQAQLYVGNTKLFCFDVPKLNTF